MDTGIGCAAFQAWTDSVGKSSFCSPVCMTPLELCNEVVLASGQPQRAKQPHIHLWPTRETRLPQDVLISGSLLKPVSSFITSWYFLRGFSASCPVLWGRALWKSLSAAERTPGVPKPWTPVCSADLPSRPRSRSLFWPRPSVLVPFFTCSPLLPDTELGSPEITAQLTQKLNIWALVSHSLDFNPHSITYQLRNLGQDTGHLICELTIITAFTSQSCCED